MIDGKWKLIGFFAGIGMGTYLTSEFFFLGIKGRQAS
jgi:hypothetical protein